MKELDNRNVTEATVCIVEETTNEILYDGTGKRTEITKGNLEGVVWWELSEADEHDPINLPCLSKWVEDYDPILNRWTLYHLATAQEPFCVKQVKIIDDDTETARQMTLGMILKIIREFSGKSIADLAKELGVSSSCINRLEHDRGVFSAETLERYCEFYGVGANDLLFWLNQSRTANKELIKDKLFSILVQAARKNERIAL